MQLREVHLENLLSFRDATLADIGPVNLLIGPNASGKSNFLDVLSLLQAAPRDLARPIAQGGGIREWIWKGRTNLFSLGKIECKFKTEEIEAPLHYLLSAKEADNTFTIHEERLLASLKNKKSIPLFDREGGNVVFKGSLSDHLLRNGDRVAKIAPTESVLKAFRDPLERRELTAVGRGLDNIRIYKNFDTSNGPGGGARHGVSTSYPPSETLAEDGFNLALVLSAMRVNRSIKKLESYLSEFSSRFGEVNVEIGGGVARILIEEQGFQRPTPGVRLSDGTLKFVCLLVVLLSTSSEPELVFIDEPETGLHPDAVRLLARAIREASQTKQIIIATHSDALVDEFSDNPEAVVVCEFDSERGTQLRRLSRKRLKAWLNDYSLGELWRKGTLGGNPW